MTQSNWFITTQPKPNADLKLICFPYAGGNASTYLSWSKSLPDNVELVAVQLPGRANRMFEACYSNMDDLIYDLLTVIPSIIDRPYIFFGHSFGSRVAFELLSQCHKNELRLPCHFIASGSRGPDIKARTEAIHHLPDTEFIDKLAELNGTPKEVLTNEELMTICLPILRADFKMSDTYRYSSNAMFECPISVLSGEQDSDITYPDLQSWEKFFSKPMKLHTLPGDHFFIESNKQLVLQKVNFIIKNTLSEIIGLV